MNKKQITSLSCFSSTKGNNNHNRKSQFNCINSTNKPMSKSLHDSINYLDTSSLHSSNSSGQNVLTLRPKPPPYDEYTAKKYGIIRSQSTYSACQDTSLCADNHSDKTEQMDVQEDSLSQYSEGDPPRLTDHLSKLSIQPHCIRPVTLRPISPSNKCNYRQVMPYTKSATESQQSPSGDSGVRLTPNETEQSIRSREMDLQHYFQSSTDRDRANELKILRLVNNKLSQNELNNQHLITKATHLIGKLRQKLKDKDFEIISLKNKLKESNEHFRSKEIFYKELEIEFRKSCQKIEDNSVVRNMTENSTQTLILSEKNVGNIDIETLSQRFEHERSQWLEEKALVISYHKQLNEKYHNLSKKNTHLENELQRFQGKYISDGEYSSDTCLESDNGASILESSTERYSAASSHTHQAVSRIVKFEESLC